MTDEKTPAERELPRLVRTFFPAAIDANVYPVAGGAVVEVIDPTATPERATRFSNWLFHEMATYNEGIKPELRIRDGLAVFRLCIYTDRLERYTVNAILRTIPSGFRNGVWTSTLAVNDAIVLMAEAEVEVLLIDRGAIQFCLAIPEQHDGRDLMPPAEERTPLYKGLDVRGLSMPVREVRKAQKPREWQITVD